MQRNLGTNYFLYFLLDKDVINMLISGLITCAAAFILIIMYFSGMASISSLLIGLILLSLLLVAFNIKIEMMSTNCDNCIHHNQCIVPINQYADPTYTAQITYIPWGPCLNFIPIHIDKSTEPENSEEED